MAEDLGTQSPEARPDDRTLTGEQIAAQTFPNSFRGYDPAHVRRFLTDLGARLDAATARIRDLEEALAEARQRPATVTVAAPETPEAVRAAHEGALEIEAAAGEQAERILAEAREQAEVITAEAEELRRTVQAEVAKALDERKADAEMAAADIISAAERESALRIVEAREEADRIVEAAKEQGRQLVIEAQAVVTRRKRAAEQQLEQLREARDHLLESMQGARRRLDDAIGAVDPSRIEERPARAERVRRDEPVTPPRGVPPVAAMRPEPEPVEVVDDVREPATPEPPAEERRTSSLRILRRVRQEPPAAPPRELVAVRGGTEIEGVRILGPKHAEPAADAETEPAESPTGADVDAAPQPPEATVVEPEIVEPEPAPAPEPDPEPEPEPEPDPAVATDAQPEPEPESEPEPEPVHGEAAPAKPVLDDLFARIRADREAAVARAHEVLAATDGANAIMTVVEAPPAEEPVDEPVRRPVEPVLSDDDEALLQRRDAAVEGIEAQLARRLKRALQDEQNETLDALRTARATCDPARLLGSPERQAERYAELSRAFLREAAMAGAGSGREEVPVDDLVEQLAADVAEPLRQRVARALESASSDELDDTGVAERLSGLYREWKAQRIARVASHYVVAAHARGAYLATPDTAQLVWIVDDGGSPCPDCDDNSLAGATRKGEPFPTGQVHPPAHVGCRCLLRATEA